MIDVTSVSKTYETAKGGLVHALQDVSLTIGRGEFVSIVGPSGCGKSTLLSIIAGLDEASHGAVGVAGVHVRRPSRDVSIVFQNPVLLPWRKVVDNVLLPIELSSRRISQQHRSKAGQVIEMVGLTGFENSYPRELSGGMQQRCAIARALMLDAPVLLMDEPFGSLDALTREQLNLEIQDIWMQTGTTVMLITHDIDEAVLLSDRVIVMSRRPGSIVRVFDIDAPRPRGHGVGDELETARVRAAIREELGVAGPVRSQQDVKEPTDVH
ncbi:MAG: ATP-binding cassette domain-containing protein [Streptosporangiales bacterium]|nr:ATP-binding cassette domain-containing protein [Streptosporangiales bacterium]